MPTRRARTAEPDDRRRRLYAAMLAVFILSVSEIASGQVMTEFPPVPFSLPRGVTAIAAGPDGNLWFTEGVANRIGRISTAGVITEYSVPTNASLPNFIAAGPDGNLWFTELNANQIGRIAPDGSITEFPIPTAGSGPRGIAAGPDGNLWFTESQGNNIGRITTAGTVTEFPVPTTNTTLNGIVAGPDGNLWFVE